MLLQSPDGKRSTLAEFLHTYLNRKFGLEQLVVEWGYNLHDALQRYSHDENLGLFWGVLTGEVGWSQNMYMLYPL